MSLTVGQTTSESSGDNRRSDSEVRTPSGDSLISFDASCYLEIFDDVSIFFFDEEIVPDEPHETENVDLTALLPGGLKLSDLFFIET
eukprot:CAMPEP_0170618652 /NCGR_PEP_ID=MMETSP0224-20130122/27072_1 /TAXON_ID=285029 /ORGANISM="Togula jolla, Strain CCCM 725" /LENGTH=86 /DNA_ID=CAMNT_0010944639 /DNA_START=57 /DNA_END=317 /DNA_ORIENTATION=+